jgi:hypothetical protein
MTWDIRGFLTRSLQLLGALDLINRRTSDAAVLPIYTQFSEQELDSMPA